MDYEQKEKFKEMIIEKRNTPVGLSVIMSMVTMVENDERFEHLAELYEGIEEYRAYATEREAKKVVEGFVSFDGSRGQKWSLDAISDELEKIGVPLEERHHFNKWILYILMNNQYSDYGGALVRLGITPAEMPKAVYILALAKLDDKDRKESIREYYGLE